MSFSTTDNNSDDVIDKSLTAFKALSTFDCIWLTATADSSANFLT